MNDETDLKETDGSPEFVMTEFNHDWTNLLDEEREGHRYKDEEWKTFFPCKYSH